VWEIALDGSPTEIIICIDNAEYLEAFEISPDGQSVAVSVNREIYLIPYDRESLSTARTSTDLKEINICPVLSPLVTSIGSTIPVKGVRWSRDGQKLAILILANEGGKQVDLIRFLDITNCENGPDRIDEFPATRFDIAGYDNAPYIQNFGYDGGYIFAMVSFTRNDGYGDLYIYNEDSNKADEKINPVDGLCCYRDPQFSPDGRFIIFAYQPYLANAKAKLYYITAVTLGTGASYEPLPLPEDFFSNPRVKPFPALRPAVSGAP
jgi:Tol biopolymer transport system component